MNMTTTLWRWRIKRLDFRCQPNPNRIEKLLRTIIYTNLHQYLMKQKDLSKSQMEFSSVLHQEKIWQKHKKLQALTTIFLKKLTCMPQQLTHDAQLEVNSGKLLGLWRLRSHLALHFMRVKGTLMKIRKNQEVSRAGKKLPISLHYKYQNIQGLASMRAIWRIRIKLHAALRPKLKEKLSWMICKILRNLTQVLGYMIPVSIAPNIDQCLLHQLEGQIVDLLMKMKRLQGHLSIKMIRWVC